ncbi:hypothetical protein [Paenibacillus amylolyticus]|uniref:hypothetical protein n=1 Tax=Paenibacillus amylolyticus TaxID=1451 RepID=UPI00286C4C2D|nr:hypothetical protein [Paenibacillus amylolyticus]
MLACGAGVGARREAVRWVLRAAMVRPLGAAPGLRPALAREPGRERAAARPPAGLRAARLRPGSAELVPRTLVGAPERALAPALRLGFFTALLLTVTSPVERCSRGSPWWREAPACAWNSVSPDRLTVVRPVALLIPTRGRVDMLFPVPIRCP